MTKFVIAKSALNIDVKKDALSVYEFGSDVAKHYFCRHCGVYPFHTTMRKQGHYRINIGCLDGVDTSTLPFDVFDGAAI